MIKDLIQSIFNFFKKKYKHTNLIKKFCETLIVIGAIVAIVTFFYQKNEWRQNRFSNEYNILSNIDSKLEKDKNREITKKMENNEIILIENGGIISRDDLEIYLNDLSDIPDVYQRGLVNLCDIDQWFGDYFKLYSRNEEIKKILEEYRIEDANYYYGLDYMVDELLERSKDCKYIK